MPSTPKHLILYNAFGWQPPAFAHVGLLQNENRQKLSKRNLDIDLYTLRNEGIFPEALINHVALLGWSHSLGTDFIPLSKLIQRVWMTPSTTSVILMVDSLTLNSLRVIL